MAMARAFTAGSMTGSSSSRSAESPASLIAGIAPERLQQLSVNAAETAVGHQDDHVPVAMLADDSRDDLVVVGEVTRASAVSPHVRDQLVRVQTFRLGERGPKHSGHHDLVRGLERDRERILKHATAGRRGSRLEDGPDTAFR